jgi:predicted transcriptional regulator
MQVLWELDAPATRSEVEAVLKDRHPMAQTTLLTLLSRLAKKGFVSIEKKGRGSVYAPLVEKRDYLAVQSSRFYKKLCGGSMSTFATALCDSELSREDLAELRRLLEENGL